MYGCAKMTTNIWAAAPLLLLVVAVASTAASGETDDATPPPPCITDDFSCKNHHCVPLNAECNGINDCGDNSDEQSCGGGVDWKGLVAAMVAAFCFGSNFIPIKRFESGDGIFFQWVLCAAIWMVGSIVQLIEGDTEFSKWAFIGGVSWATGNLTVVPVIKTIGLAQGMLVWGSFNMLLGWAAGRFGFFGIIPELPKSELFEIIGIILALLGTIIYGFLETEVKNVADKHITVETEPLMGSTQLNDVLSKPEKTDWAQGLSPTKRRVIGLSLSMLGGLLYSLTFDPSQWQMDNQVGASQNALRYVYPQFTGIFFASTCYMGIYCVIMKNRPSIYPRLLFPALISGLMWGIAQASWFVANQHLSQAVSYPIVTTLPGVIASVWGLLVFGEIRGRRNYIILAAAYTFTFASVGCIVKSKS